MDMVRHAVRILHRVLPRRPPDESVFFPLALIRRTLASIDKLTTYPGANNLDFGGF
jgi:hypothetical protein